MSSSSTKIGSIRTVRALLAVMTTAAGLAVAVPLVFGGASAQAAAPGHR